MVCSFVLRYFLLGLCHFFFCLFYCFIFLLNFLWFAELFLLLNLFLGFWLKLLCFLKEILMIVESLFGQFEFFFNFIYFRLLILDFSFNDMNLGLKLALSRHLGSWLRSFFRMFMLFLFFFLWLFWLSWLWFDFCLFLLFIWFWLCWLFFVLFVMMFLKLLETTLWSHDGFFLFWQDRQLTTSQINFCMLIFCFCFNFLCWFWSFWLHQACRYCHLFQVSWRNLI